VDDGRLHPIYTWREARTAGASRRQVEADGARITRGLYLSEAVSATLRTRCLAWTRLLPDDAAFGLQTAAALLGLPVPPSPDVHIVLRPQPVLPQRRGLVVHVRRLGEQDVTVHDGLRLTSPPQLFLDLAAQLPPQELVAVGDAMSRRGLLRPDEIAARLDRADRVRGVVAARRIAPMLSPRAMSRPESVLRYWLLTSDLPDPRIQLAIHDHRGREVAHADLGYEEWKVALEYEGRQHAEPEQFGQDIDRYSLMAADGWLILRFAGRHLKGPMVVVERTRRALLSRGWHPLN
jgi:hypothetical protein